MSLNARQQNIPLTSNLVMAYAEQTFADIEIISRPHDAPRHIYTYKEAFIRTRRLANAISKFNLPTGASIATLGWNDHRHFELFYAITCSGFVYHKINPALNAEKITLLVKNGEEALLFLEPEFLPFIEALDDKSAAGKQYILLTDEQHMPNSTLTNIRSYETFINVESEQFIFPKQDQETICSRCYISTTTKTPLTMCSSHQERFIRTMSEIMPNALQLNANKVMLPVLMLNNLPPSLKTTTDKVNAS